VTEENARIELISPST